MRDGKTGSTTAIGNPAADGGFEQYTSEVYGWAFRLLGRHHDALDVVQDVFLRWDAQCARQTPKRPRGWLRRVTLNRAIDLHRQRRAAPESLEDASRLPAAAIDAGASPTTGASPTAGARLDRELLRNDVAAAFHKLSEVQRSVLVAKVYDEMTFARIAGELGLAVPTVKTHYLRAVRTVRDRLRERWAGEDLS